MDKHEMIVDWHQFRNEGVEPFPGAGFIFSDNQWNLEGWKTMAHKPSGCILNFDNIEAWALKSIKEYIAWGWLAQDYGLSWCKDKIICIRKLIEYVNIYRPGEITQLIKLNGSDEGFAFYLRETSQSKDRAYVIANSLSNFAKWCSKEYNIPLTFRPHRFINKPSKKKKLDSGVQVIPTEVCINLMAAIGKRHRDLIEKRLKKPASRKRSIPSELLYLQVLKIMLSTPLRLSQILLMPRKPIRESQDTEAPGIWIKFYETKTHQGECEEFIVEQFADIVHEAIETTQGLTNELFEISGQDLLFLSGKDKIRNISTDAFRTWLNGREDRQGNVVREGFIQRNNIKYNGEYYWINPHQTRHTMATQVYVGGAGIGTVANYLVHRDLSYKMTGVYVHGEERHIKELKEVLDRKQISGKPVPLLNDREVHIGDISELDLAYYKQLGMYIQPTPYGFCTRPAKKGTCPNSEPCWRDLKNDVCDTAILLPKAIKNMEKDMELVNQQYEIWSNENPESPYLSNIKAIKTQYERVKLFFYNENSEVMSVEEGKSFVEKDTTNESIINNVSSVNRKRKKSGAYQKPPKRIKNNSDDKVNKMFLLYINDPTEKGNIRVHNFCKKLNITPHLLMIRYPDFYHEINELEKENYASQLLKKAMEEFQNAKTSRSEIPLTVLAKKLNIDRYVLYKHFSELVDEIQTWNSLIRNEIKENRDKLKIGIQKEKRMKEDNEIIKKIEKILFEIEKHKKFVSIDSFLRSVGIGIMKFNFRFSEYRTKLEELNKRFNKEKVRIKQYEELFKIQWETVLSSEKIVTVSEFAKQCKVDRNLFYKEFPHWIKIIEQRREEAFRELDQKVRQKWTSIQCEGIKISVKDFQKLCGLSRSIMDKYFDDIKEQIKRRD